MIPRRIFTYWEGPVHPYIELCRDSFEKLSGIRVDILDKDSVYNYIRSGILHEGHKRLPEISMKVDCLRLALLVSNGGMWCDMDTLMLSVPEMFFNTDRDFIGMRWQQSGRMLNGYISSVKDGEFVTACLEHVNSILESGPRKHQDGVEFGENTFIAVMGKGKFNIGYAPVETMCPIDLPNAVLLWGSNKNIAQFIRDDTAAIALNNSQPSDNIKGRSLEDLTNSPTLTGSAIRHYIYQKYKISGNIELNDRSGAKEFREAAIEHYSPMCDNVVFRDKARIGCDQFITHTGLLKLNRDLGHAITPNVAKFFRSPFYTNDNYETADQFDYSAVRFDMADVASDKLELWRSKPKKIIPVSIMPLAIIRSRIGSAWSDYLETNRMIVLPPEIAATLPENFGPEHPQWKVPSFRQRYLKYVGGL